MENKIAIICPTRDRPDSIQRLYNSWKACSDGYFSTLYIVLDEDNQHIYPRISGCQYIIAPRTRGGMCDPTNFAANQLKNQYPAIMWVGDDHVFRSKNWDVIFLNTLKELGGVGFIYGDDLLQRRSLPTACMISTNIIKALGFMVLPELRHLYIDNFWKELGLSLNKLVFLENVVIEHLHPAAGKAPWDAQYSSVNNGETMDNDCKLFQQWNISPFGKHKDIQIIRDYIK